MRLRRVGIAIAIAATAWSSACKDHPAETVLPGPVEYKVTGTWDLYTVNGRRLPATEAKFCCINTSTLIVSGVITFSEDGQYVSESTGQRCDYDPLTRKTTCTAGFPAVSGSWTRDSNRIRLSGWIYSRGSVHGDDLSLCADGLIECQGHHTYLRRIPAP